MIFHILGLNYSSESGLVDRGKYVGKDLPGHHCILIGDCGHWDEYQR